MFNLNLQITLKMIKTNADESKHPDRREMKVDFFLPNKFEICKKERHTLVNNVHKSFRKKHTRIV